jgi:hypothetical protein
MACVELDCKADCYRGVANLKKVTTNIATLYKKLTVCIRQ